MKKCFLCKKTDDLTDFSDNSFVKCCDVIAIRKQRGLKYGDLELPTANKADYGYHIECYRKVTSLKRKYKEDDGSTTKNLTKITTTTKSLPSTSAQEDLSGRDSTSRDDTIQALEDETSQHDDTIQALDDETSQHEEDTEMLHSDKQQTKKLCLFCLQHSKRVKSRRQYITSSSLQNTRNNVIHYAETLQDTDLIERLGSEEVLSYHQQCWVSYYQKYKSCLDTHNETSCWHKTRQIQKEAFSALSDFIKEEIIEKEKVYYMSHVYNRYKALLTELSEGEILCQTFTSQHLENKILKEFQDSITIKNTNTPVKKKIMHKKEIDVKKLANESALIEIAEEAKIENFAFKLRECIKSVKKKKLPEKLTPTEIIEGECAIPEALHNFISHLIQGPDRRRYESEKDDVRIHSICQDIIYSVHKGRIKPSKHLQLGITIKTLTNSRKVVNLLNRLGHSVSYTTVEELETEMTYTAHEANKIIPSGIEPHNSALSTHVAFDNFDRYVETLDGKDTLHDTVGIIYQFPAENTNSENTDTRNTCSIESSANRRRRRFDEIPKEITPYCRKPKAVTSLAPLNKIETNTASKNIAIIKDIVWALSVTNLAEITPMWTGYNSKVSVDPSSSQVVNYLPQINESPTSYSVVHETMKIAQVIKKECDQEFIIVTYDLAIAKMALQIQIQEAPTFDDLFINLGGFHIELAFFKALGKLIDSCGLENILIENNILAAGSINAFIGGKHFNRCKRIHGLISAALQTLHIQRFYEDTLLEPNQINEHLTDFMLNETVPTEPTQLPRLLEFHIEEYMKFAQSTLNGEHGKTAQFYMTYINMMNIFFRLSRSIRTTDFNLFVETMFELSNIFFIFNHHNYARWILIYISNMIQAKETNPQFLEEFQKGAFGIKRTSVKLSRSPVDLVLEQTINANAGNSLTGLNHITNSIGARQRWALNHSLRSKIVATIMEEVGIVEKDDVVSELHKSRMEKNSQSLKELITGITKSMNPFDITLTQESLFKIFTGRAATEETAKFLLSALNQGEKEKIKYIEECNNDPARFERPLKKNNILNFASESTKKPLKGEKTTTLLKMERDVFGRLLAIAMEKKIDINLCMSYPLAPVPPALAQYNGEMNHTQKSKLAIKLKSMINVDDNQINEDIYLVDGFHLLRTLGTVAQSYGKISEQILGKICQTTAKEVHLVFDVYKTPSIKESERQKRQQYSAPYQITGAEQKRDQNFSKCLNNVCFKKAFVDFLCRHWESEYLAPIISKKKFFLTIDSNCFSFSITKDNKVSKNLESDYECTHEEADTRLIFHLNKSEKNTALIRASDTDVLIIIIGNLHKMPQKEVWLTSATKAEAINCTKLFESLGQDLSKSLPGFHAFTGCDYTASFKGKGKVRPFEILKKNLSYQRAFFNLNNPYQTDEISDFIQKFTCEIYGMKICKTVNEARVQMFKKKYSTMSTRAKFLKKIQNFDSGNIPPCWSTLKQKIIRTAFINSMWQCAAESSCVKFDATHCGWKFEDDIYKIKWFEGHMTPLRVEDITIDESESGESSDFDSEDDY